jgi:circadian clock protein KaiB
MGLQCEVDESNAPWDGPVSSAPGCIGEASGTSLSSNSTMGAATIGGLSALETAGVGGVKRSSLADKKAASKDAPAADPDVARYLLRLFVTGTTPRSARAIRNIRAICEDNLPGRYDLEVIDIYQHPDYVKAEQIIVTPTLVKQYPLPIRKLIGDLSDTDRVLAGLDIIPRPSLTGPPETKHAA